MGLVRDVRTMVGLLGDVDRKLDALVRTAPPIGHDDVRELFETLFEAHIKLDAILRYCYPEGDGGEEETDLG